MTATARPKVKTALVSDLQSGSPTDANGSADIQASNVSNPVASSAQSDPMTAAPGPIPATTPLVVRQDQNGVQWIAFEYSRERVKLEYTIRCDVESVDTNSLKDEFKTANCVYPRANVNKDGYTGNRLGYESECNTVGWALAELNPMLREKRGLIQRAVDSWRNSNQNPRLRSRRVRRQAKMNTRKAQTTNAPLSSSTATSPTFVLNVGEVAVLDDSGALVVCALRVFILAWRLTRRLRRRGF